MARVVRETGDLEVSPRIRSLLAELRLLEGTDLPPELDIERVREAESAVGMRLPDDFLAVCAARLSRLSKAWSVDVSGVLGLSGQARAVGARGDLVAVAREPGRGAFLCLEKGASAEDGVALWRYDPESRETTPERLERWLSARVSEVRAARADAPAYDPGLDATFVPRMVRPLPGGSPGSRVRHPTFGEGRVLLEIGSGPTRKVKVDFPGKGLRLLQARFLEPLDEPPGEAE